MHILSIETSCDETSIALVKASGSLPFRSSASRSEGWPEFQIKKHLIASQIETHRPFGGVVPNLAKHEHQINLPLLLSKFKTCGELVESIENSRPNIIAVTIGPGLEPCLWQGIEFAKKIQKEYLPKAVIIPTNHLHGHMYSFLLPQKTKNPSGHNLVTSSLFPAIQLLVSGGHTILIYMKSLTDYKKLGETRDDAAGEAFDKVARMLNLPYPGGPEIEKLAKTIVPERSGAKSKDYINFPRPMLRDKNYDFSFSGLKTAVLYYLKNNNLNPSGYPMVAHAFQTAAIDVLVTKTLRAAKEYGTKSVILSGGVAANQALRNEFKKRIRTLAPSCHSERSEESQKNKPLIFLSAPKKFQGDNAAMIAVAGYLAFLKNKKYKLEAQGNLNL